MRVTRYQAWLRGESEYCNGAQIHSVRTGAFLRRADDDRVTTYGNAYGRRRRPPAVKFSDLVRRGRLGLGRLMRIAAVLIMLTGTACAQYGPQYVDACGRPLAPPPQRYGAPPKQPQRPAVSAPEVYVPAPKCDCDCAGQIKPLAEQLGKQMAQQFADNTRRVTDELAGIRTDIANLNARQLATDKKVTGWGEWTQQAAGKKAELPVELPSLIERLEELAKSKGPAIVAPIVKYSLSTWLAGGAFAASPLLYFFMARARRRLEGEHAAAAAKLEAAHAAAAAKKDELVDLATKRKDELLERLIDALRPGARSEASADSKPTNGTTSAPEAHTADSKTGSAVAGGVAVVTTESPPPPAQVVTRNRWHAVESHKYREAHEWAQAEMGKKYGLDVIGLLEAEQGMIDQWLKAQK